MGIEKLDRVVKCNSVMSGRICFCRTLILVSAVLARPVVIPQELGEGGGIISKD